MPLHIPMDELLQALRDHSLYTGIKNERAVTSIKSKNCSDGHHTFGELYEHRYLLWIALCRMVYLHYPVWRSKLHADGTMFEDSFVLGIGKKEGEQMTYHLHLRDWDRCSFAETLDNAPVYDGHKPEDVLRRIEEMIL